MAKPDASRRTDALRAVAEALNGSPDPDSAMVALLPHLRAMVGLRTAWVFRFDAASRRFEPLAATGLPPALSREDRAPLRLGSCECQRRFHRGELYQALNMVRCSRLEEATGDRGGLSVHASVPLVAKGRALGILNVAAEGEGSFAETDLALLTAVGQQVAVAVDRGLLYQAAERRAVRLSALAQRSREWALAETDEQVLRGVVRASREILGFPRTVCLGEREGRWRVLVGGGSVAGARSGLGGDYVWRDSRAARRVALTADGRVVLQVELPPRHVFDAVDDELLEVLGLHAQTLLERRAREDVEREAAVLRERQRIAADLHDAVSQRLFSALLTARAARLTTIGAPREGMRLMAAVEQQIGSAQTEMRTLVDALHQPGTLNLLALVRGLATSEPLAGMPELIWKLPKELPALSDGAAVAFMRVAEEALHNAWRHAGATRVAVTVAYRRGRLSLRVADDGIGFQPARARARHGIRGMRLRARSVGARLTIRHPTAGTGTTVVLSLRLPEKGPAHD